jgi:NodT family efflux transporter outer membrane factor (OMF) lipoprotein
LPVLIGLPGIRPLKGACFVAGALLVGCTVGPDYRKPEIAVPQSYMETASGPSADAEVARWWQGFADPQLSHLIELALVQNLDVEAAVARIREARAAEREAGAAALPEVDAQASYSRQRISENAIPIPPIGVGTPGGGTGFALPGTEFSTFRVGFDASWELDLFGGTRRSVEAAKARTGAAIWSQRDAEVTVAAEVAQAYLALRTAQQRLANARAELERQQRFERLVAARAQGGLVTGQDLAQQQSERSGAAAAIPVLEAQAKAEIHALGVLVGTTPEALAPSLCQPAAVPQAPAIPAGLPSDLLRRRPDIRAAERNLAASTADIGVAVADLYPRISLTTVPSLISTSLGRLLEWGSRNYSAGPSLSWPLFDGGRRRATVDVRNAQEGLALVQYRKSVLTALQDVEDALSRIAADRAQIGDLQQSLVSAGRAEDVARTRYRGGLVTYSDVLVAQAQRLKMEGNVVDARGALARDTVSLAKALGGGWPDVSKAEASR